MGTVRLSHHDEMILLTRPPCDEHIWPSPSGVICFLLRVFSAKGLPSQGLGGS